MDLIQVRRFWNATAGLWTRLSRAGYDTYRDHHNTPAFVEMLPEVAGLSGLDVGCGEGYNTRLLAQRGAHMTAVDIAEAYRVLRPGGSLQFSIRHPCCDTAHRRNLRGPDGRTYAYEVGGYFERLDGRVDSWSFSAAPPEARASLPPFQTPRSTRTLSGWVNLLLERGFVLERLGEPRPGDRTVQGHPNIQDAQVVAYFLHVRARKPAGRTG